MYIARGSGGDATFRRDSRKGGEDNLTEVDMDDDTVISELLRPREYYKHSEYHSPKFRSRVRQAKRITKTEDKRGSDMNFATFNGGRDLRRPPDASNADSNRDMTRETEFESGISRNVEDEERIRSTGEIDGREMRKRKTSKGQKNRIAMDSRSETNGGKKKRNAEVYRKFRDARKLRRVSHENVAHGIDVPNYKLKKLANVKSDRDSTMSSEQRNHVGAVSSKVTDEDVEKDRSRYLSSSTPLENNFAQFHSSMLSPQINHAEQEYHPKKDDRQSLQSQNVETRSAKTGNESKKEKVLKQKLKLLDSSLKSLRELPVDESNENSLSGARRITSSNTSSTYSSDARTRQTSRIEVDIPIWRGPDIDDSILAENSEEIESQQRGRPSGGKSVHDLRRNRLGISRVRRIHEKRKPNRLRFREKSRRDSRKPASQYDNPHALNHVEMIDHDKSPRSRSSRSKFGRRTQNNGSDVTRLKKYLQQDVKDTREASIDSTVNKVPALFADPATLTQDQTSLHRLENFRDSSNFREDLSKRLYSRDNGPLAYYNYPPFSNQAILPNQAMLRDSFRMGQRYWSAIPSNYYDHLNSRMIGYPSNAWSNVQPWMHFVNSTQMGRFWGNSTLDSFRAPEYYGSWQSSGNLDDVDGISVASGSTILTKSGGKDSDKALSYESSATDPKVDPEETISSEVSKKNRSTSMPSSLTSAVKSRAFSKVVEPLTMELQRVLAVIKAVNGDLMKEDERPVIKSNRTSDVGDAVWAKNDSLTKRETPTLVASGVELIDESKIHTFSSNGTSGDSRLDFAAPNDSFAVPKIDETVKRGIRRFLAEVDGRVDEHRNSSRSESFDLYANDREFEKLIDLEKRLYDETNKTHPTILKALEEPESYPPNATTRISQNPSGTAESIDDPLIASSKTQSNQNSSNAASTKRDSDSSQLIEKLNKVLSDQISNINVARNVSGYRNPSDLLIMTQKELQNLNAGSRIKPSSLDSHTLDLTTKTPRVADLAAKVTDSKTNLGNPMISDAVTSSLADSFPTTDVLFVNVVSLEQDPEMVTPVDSEFSSQNLGLEDTVVTDEPSSNSADLIMVTEYYFGNETNSNEFLPQDVASTSLATPDDGSGILSVTCKPAIDFIAVVNSLTTNQTEQISTNEVADTSTTDQTEQISILDTNLDSTTTYQTFVTEATNDVTKSANTPTESVDTTESTTVNTNFTELVQYPTLNPFDVEPRTDVSESTTTNPSMTSVYVSILSSELSTSSPESMSPDYATTQVSLSLQTSDTTTNDVITDQEVLIIAVQNNSDDGIDHFDDLFNTIESGSFQLPTELSIESEPKIIIIKIPATIESITSPVIIANDFHANENEGYTKAGDSELKSGTDRVAVDVIDPVVVSAMSGTNSQARFDAEPQKMVSSPYLQIGANTETALGIYDSEADADEELSGHKLVLDERPENNRESDENTEESVKSKFSSPGYSRLGRKLNSFEETEQPTVEKYLDPTFTRDYSSHASNHATKMTKDLEQIDDQDQTSKYVEVTEEPIYDQEYFLSFERLKNLNIHDVIGLEPTESGVIVHRAKCERGSSTEENGTLVDEINPPNHVSSNSHEGAIKVHVKRSADDDTCIPCETTTEQQCLPCDSDSEEPMASSGEASSTVAETPKGAADVDEDNVNSGLQTTEEQIVNGSTSYTEASLVFANGMNVHDDNLMMTATECNPDLCTAAGPIAEGTLGSSSNELSTEPESLNETVPMKPTGSQVTTTSSTQTSEPQESPTRNAANEENPESMVDETVRDKGTTVTEKRGTAMLETTSQYLVSDEETGGSLDSTSQNGEAIQTTTQSRAGQPEPIENEDTTETLENSTMQLETTLSLVTTESTTLTTVSSYEISETTRQPGTKTAITFEPTTVTAKQAPQTATSEHMDSLETSGQSYTESLTTLELTTQRLVTSEHRTTAAVEEKTTASVDQKTTASVEQTRANDDAAVEIQEQTDKTSKNRASTGPTGEGELDTGRQSTSYETSSESEKTMESGTEPNVPTESKTTTGMVKTMETEGTTVVEASSEDSTSGEMEGTNKVETTFETDVTTTRSDVANEEDAANDTIMGNENEADLTTTGESSSEKAATTSSMELTTTLRTSIVEQTLTEIETTSEYIRTTLKDEEIKSTAESMRTSQNTFGSKKISESTTEYATTSECTTKNELAKEPEETNGRTAQAEELTSERIAETEKKSEATSQTHLTEIDTTTEVESTSQGGFSINENIQDTTTETTSIFPGDQNSLTTEWIPDILLGTMDRQSSVNTETTECRANNELETTSHRVSETSGTVAIETTRDTGTELIFVTGIGDNASEHGETPNAGAGNDSQDLEETTIVNVQPISTKKPTLPKKTTGKPTIKSVALTPYPVNEVTFASPVPPEEPTIKTVNRRTTVSTSEIPKSGAVGEMLSLTTEGIGSGSQNQDRITDACESTTVEDTTPSYFLAMTEPKAADELLTTEKTETTIRVREFGRKTDTTEAEIVSDQGIDMVESTKITSELGETATKINKGSEESEGNKGQEDNAEVDVDTTTVEKSDENSGVSSATTEEQGSMTGTVGKYDETSSERGTESNERGTVTNYFVESTKVTETNCGESTTVSEVIESIIKEAPHSETVIVVTESGRIHEETKTASRTSTNEIGGMTKEPKKEEPSSDQSTYSEATTLTKGRTSMGLTSTDDASSNEITTRQEESTMKPREKGKENCTEDDQENKLSKWYDDKLRTTTEQVGTISRKTNADVEVTESVDKNPAKSDSDKLSAENTSATQSSQETTTTKQESTTELRHETQEPKGGKIQEENPEMDENTSMTEHSNDLEITTEKLTTTSSSGKTTMEVTERTTEIRSETSAFIEKTSSGTTYTPGKATFSEEVDLTVAATTVAHSTEETTTEEDDSGDELSEQNPEDEEDEKEYENGGQPDWTGYDNSDVDTESTESIGQKQVPVQTPTNASDNTIEESTRNQSTESTCSCTAEAITSTRSAASDFGDRKVSTTTTSGQTSQSNSSASCEATTPTPSVINHSISELSTTEQILKATHISLTSTLATTEGSSISAANSESTTPIADTTLTTNEREKTTENEEEEEAGEKEEETEEPDEDELAMSFTNSVSSTAETTLSTDDEEKESQNEDKESRNEEATTNSVSTSSQTTCTKGITSTTNEREKSAGDNDVGEEEEPEDREETTEPPEEDELTMSFTNSESPMEETTCTMETTLTTNNEEKESEDREKDSRHKEATTNSVYKSSQTSCTKETTTLTSSEREEVRKGTHKGESTTLSTIFDTSLTTNNEEKQSRNEEATTNSAATPTQTSWMEETTTLTTEREEEGGKGTRKGESTLSTNLETTLTTHHADRGDEEKVKEEEKEKELRDKEEELKEKEKELKEKDEKTEEDLKEKEKELEEKDEKLKTEENENERLEKELEDLKETGKEIENVVTDVAKLVTVIEEKQKELIDEEEELVKEVQEKDDLAKDLEEEKEDGKKMEAEEDRIADEEKDLEEKEKELAEELANEEERNRERGDELAGEEKRLKEKADELDKAMADENEKKNELATEEAELNEKRKELEDKENDDKRREQDLEEEENCAEKKTKELDEKEKEIDEHQMEVDNKEKKVDEEEKKIDEKGKEIDDKEKMIENEEEELEEMEKELKDVKEKELDEKEKKLNEKEEKLEKDLVEEDQKRKDLEEKEKKMLDEKEELEKEKKKAEEIDEKEKQLNDRENELAKELVDEDEKEKDLEEKEKKICDEEKELEEKKQDAKDLDDKAKELTDKEDELVKKLADEDEKEKDLEEKEKEICDEEKELEEKKQDVKDLDDKAKELTDKEDELAKKLADEDGKEKDLEEKEKEIRDQETDLEKQQEDAKDVDEKAKELREKEKALDKDLAEKEQKEKELEDEEEEIQDEERELEENKKEAKDLDEKAKDLMEKENDLAKDFADEEKKEKDLAEKEKEIRDRETELEKQQEDAKDLDEKAKDLREKEMVLDKDLAEKEQKEKDLEDEEKEIQDEERELEENKKEAKDLDEKAKDLMEKEDELAKDLADENQKEKDLEQKEKNIRDQEMELEQKKKEEAKDLDEKARELADEANELAKDLTDEKKKEEDLKNKEAEIEAEEKELEEKRQREKGMDKKSKELAEEEDELRRELAEKEQKENDLNGREKEIREKEKELDEERKKEEEDLQNKMNDLKQREKNVKEQENRNKHTTPCPTISSHSPSISSSGSNQPEDEDEDVTKAPDENFSPRPEYYYDDEIYEETSTELKDEATERDEATREEDEEDATEFVTKKVCMKVLRQMTRHGPQPESDESSTKMMCVKYLPIGEPEKATEFDETTKIDEESQNRKKRQARRLLNYESPPKSSYDDATNYTSLKKHRNSDEISGKEGGTLNALESGPISDIAELIPKHFGRHSKYPIRGYTRWYKVPEKQRQKVEIITKKKHDRPKQPWFDGIFIHGDWNEVPTEGPNPSATENCNCKDSYPNDNWPRRKPHKGRGHRRKKPSHEQKKRPKGGLAKGSKGGTKLPGGIKTPGGSHTSGDTKSSGGNKAPGDNKLSTLETESTESLDNGKSTTPLSLTIADWELMITSTAATELAEVGETASENPEELLNERTGSTEVTRSEGTTSMEVTESEDVASTEGAGSEGVASEEATGSDETRLTKVTGSEEAASEKVTKSDETSTPCLETDGTEATNSDEEELWREYEEGTATEADEGESALVNAGDSFLGVIDHLTLDKLSRDIVHPNNGPPLMYGSNEAEVLSPRGYEILSESQLHRPRTMRQPTKRNDDKTSDSWPTEGAGWFYVGGKASLKRIPKSERVSKKPPHKNGFTVNVLHLDYDEDEESHKVKPSRNKLSRNKSGNGDDQESTPVNEDFDDYSCDDTSDDKKSDEGGKSEDENDGDARGCDLDDKTKDDSVDRNNNDDERRNGGSDWSRGMTTYYDTCDDESDDDAATPKPKNKNSDEKDDVNAKTTGSPLVTCFAVIVKNDKKPSDYYKRSDSEESNSSTSEGQFPSRKSRSIKSIHETIDNRQKRHYVPRIKYRERPVSKTRRFHGMKSSDGMRRMKKNSRTMRRRHGMYLAGRNGSVGEAEFGTGVKRSTEMSTPKEGLFSKDRANDSVSAQDASELETLGDLKKLLYGFLMSSNDSRIGKRLPNLTDNKTGTPFSIKQYSMLIDFIHSLDEPGTDPTLNISKEPGSTDTVTDPDVETSPDMPETVGTSEVTETVVFESASQVTEDSQSSISDNGEDDSTTEDNFETETITKLEDYNEDYDVESTTQRLRDTIIIMESDDVSNMQLIPVAKCNEVQTSNVKNNDVLLKQVRITKNGDYESSTATIHLDEPLPLLISQTEANVIGEGTILQANESGYPENSENNRGSYDGDVNDESRNSENLIVKLAQQKVLSNALSSGYADALHILDERPSFDAAARSRAPKHERSKFDSETEVLHRNQPSDLSNDWEAYSEKRRFQSRENLEPESSSIQSKRSLLQVDDSSKIKKNAGQKMQVNPRKRSKASKIPVDSRNGSKSKREKSRTVSIPKKGEKKSRSVSKSKRTTNHSVVGEKHETKFIPQSKVLVSRGVHENNVESATSQVTVVKKDRITEEAKKRGPKKANEKNDDQASSRMQPNLLGKIKLIIDKAIGKVNEHSGVDVEQKFPASLDEKLLRRSVEKLSDPENSQNLIENDKKNISKKRESAENSNFREKRARDTTFKVTENTRDKQRHADKTPPVDPTKQNAQSLLTYKYKALESEKSKAKTAKPKENLDTIPDTKNDSKKLIHDKFSNSTGSGENFQHEHTVRSNDRNSSTDPKNVLPMVKDLIKNQDLRNVERVIVYVDKDKESLRDGSQKLRRISNSANKSDPLTDTPLGMLPIVDANGSIATLDFSLDELVSKVVDKVLSHIPSIAASSTSFVASALPVTRWSSNSSTGSMDRATRKSDVAEKRELKQTPDADSAKILEEPDSSEPTEVEDFEFVGPKNQFWKNSEDQKTQSGPVFVNRFGNLYVIRIPDTRDVPRANRPYAGYNSERRMKLANAPNKKRNYWLNKARSQLANRRLTRLREKLLRERLSSSKKKRSNAILVDAHSWANLQAKATPGEVNEMAATERKMAAMEGEMAATNGKMADTKGEMATSKGRTGFAKNTNNIEMGREKSFAWMRSLDDKIDEKIKIYQALRDEMKGARRRSARTRGQSKDFQVLRGIGTQKILFEPDIELLERLLYTDMKNDNDNSDDRDIIEALENSGDYVIAADDRLGNDYENEYSLSDNIYEVGDYDSQSFYPDESNDNYDATFVDPRIDSEENMNNDETTSQEEGSQAHRSKMGEKIAASEGGNKTYEIKLSAEPTFSNDSTGDRISNESVSIIPIANFIDHSHRTDQNLPNTSRSLDVRRNVSTSMAGFDKTSNALEKSYESMKIKLKLDQILDHKSPGIAGLSMPKTQLSSTNSTNHLQRSIHDDDSKFQNKQILVHRSNHQHATTELSSRMNSSVTPRSPMLLADSKATNEKKRSTSNRSVALRDQKFPASMASGATSKEKNSTRHGELAKRSKNDTTQSDSKRVKNTVRLANNTQHGTIKNGDEKSMSASGGKNNDNDTANAEELAGKIVNFAIDVRSKLGNRGERSGAIESDVSSLVDNFGTEVLGLTDENDKESWRCLLGEIVNVEKNVNTTLEIIDKKLHDLKSANRSASTLISRSSQEIKGSQRSDENSARLGPIARDKNIKERATDELRKIFTQLKSESVKARNSGKTDGDAAKELQRMVDDIIGATQAEKKGEKVLKKSPANKSMSSGKIGEKSSKSIQTKGSGKNSTTDNSKSKSSRSDRPGISLIKKNSVSAKGKKKESQESISKRISGDKTIDRDIKDILTSAASDGKETNSAIKETQETANENMIQKRSLKAYVAAENISGVSKASQAHGHLSSETRTDYPHRSRRLQSIEKFKPSKANCRCAVKSNDDPSMLTSRRICRQLRSIDRCCHKQSQSKLKRKEARKISANISKTHEIRSLNTKSNDGSRKVVTDEKNDAEKPERRAKNAKERLKKSKSGTTQSNSESVGGEETQTIIPIDGGRIHIKYIYKKSKKRNDANVGRKEKTLRQEQSNRYCKNCLCDLVRAISDLKEFLPLERNGSLSLISEYNCTKFNDVGSEIILGEGDDSAPKGPRSFCAPRREKYIKPEEVEATLSSISSPGNNEHETLLLPGVTANIPCSGVEEMYVMSLNRLTYTWIHPDGRVLTGPMIQRNGNLRVQDIDAKDAGNYSCIVSYMNPESEEEVTNVYNHSIRVVTLPQYSLQGATRYKLETCDDRELEALATHLPKKLDKLLCRNGICDVYIMEPRCYYGQMSIKTILVLSSGTTMISDSSSLCDLSCREAIQNKMTLLFIHNLKNVLEKTKSDSSQENESPDRHARLVPVGDVRRSARDKHGKSSKKTKNEAFTAEVALLVGCPAGYDLRDTNCYPCTPGHYSEEGSARCKKCPSGTYQPDIGARYCRACTNPFVEGCFHTLWRYNFVIMIITVVSGIFIITTVSLLICCCIRSRRENCAPITEWVSQYRCENDIASRQSPRACVRKIDSPMVDQRATRTNVLRKNRRHRDWIDMKRDEEFDEQRIHLVPKLSDEILREQQRCERSSNTSLPAFESYRSHLGHRNQYPTKPDNCKRPTFFQPDFK